MARIPIAALPGQIQTGNQTVRTAQMPVQQESSMARGLSQVADTSARVVMLANRADDFKNMTQAGIAMQEAQVEFAKFQQSTPDESQWLGQWEKTVQNVQTRMAELPLSAEARQTLMGRFSTWSTNGTIQVNAEAFRQKGKNAIRAVENAKTYGLQTGQWDAADQALEDLKGTGLLHATELEAMALDVQGSKMAKFAEDYKAAKAEAIRSGDYATASMLDEEARLMNVITEKQYEVLQKQNVTGQLVTDVQRKAEVDPAGAREMLKTFELPDVDRRNLESFIEQQDRVKQIGEIKDIADKVATGEIKRGEEVQFSFITSPAEQQKIKTEIDAAPPTQDEVAFELLALEQAIDEFDPVAFGNNNPEEVRKMVALSARVEKLPVYVKGEVSTKWRRRLSGEGPTTKEAFVSSGLKVINELVAADRNKFFKRDKTVIPEKRAEFAQFEMDMTRMANELKRLMPDNPTPQQAMEIINQVTGASVSAQMMDAFRPIKAQGTEPAMPGGAGSINPMLFPSR